jgi:hypothetical protein
MCVNRKRDGVFPESVLAVPRYNIFLKLQGLFLESDSASFITFGSDLTLTGHCKDYSVKKGNDFPVPSRDVTNQTLLGGE